MKSTEEMAPLPETQITCDYLIVGAGTACLSFVDTVLSLREDVTFLIVDRNSAPGGHWTTAYEFVTLHQPSCYYGVKSLPLGNLDKNGKELYDLNDRASAKDICDYYKKVVENFKATGRVQTFFEANYEGEATDNGRSIHVKCTKVVQSETNVIVPSMRKRVPFPIDESVVKAIPLNDLPTCVGKTQQKYMVIGAGKSGVDAISYLMDHCNIDPDRITWIVSETFWYWIRDGISPQPIPGPRFWKQVNNTFFETLVDGKSADDVFLLMEKVGSLGRVDPNDGHFPRSFKGGSITKHELENLRRLKNVVKNLGRVTSITSSEVIIQNGVHSIPFSPSDTLVVDCMANNMYGYYDIEENCEIFNPHKIRLGPTTSLFNPSHSSTQAAFLEAFFDDSAAGDTVKNSFCFFPRGPKELKMITNQQLYLLLFYSEMKTNKQFSHFGPYSRFVLGDRTDVLQSAHHGGLVHLLWNLFGPVQMKKKADYFLEKMENGGFEDFPTHPMADRNEVDPKKIEAVLRKNSKSVTNTVGTSRDATPKKKKRLLFACCFRAVEAIQTKLHRIFL
eukprot:jgi/Psemu1/324309/estExt_fgenesh1_pg.C_1330009